jgi:enamine deaminase RidA (YjgF/YER057c/UK114 family)
MDRQCIFSGSKWEKIAAYSRAIRVGNIIEVAGTTAVDGDKLIGKGDPAAQAKFIIEKIGRALEGLGGSLKNVTRTTIYVTDISNWEQVARVHGEFFEGITPASTLIGVSGLIDPELLVEIAVTAVLN